MNYRIEELAILVLQNLEEVAEEQLTKIIAVIDHTRCSYYKPLFEFAASFYKQNGKMPDEDYMTIHFENILYDTKIPFHEQFVEDFIRYINTEATAVRTQLALNRGDFSSALSIIQEMQTSISAPIMSMSELFKLWISNRKEFSFGLKTGIPELDNVFKFLGYKTLNVFAAPPANFKTTIACSILFDAVYRQKLNVVYFTLEDTSEIIRYNMLAAFANEKGIPITAEEIKRFLMPESKLEMFEKLTSDWDAEVEGQFVVISAAEIGSFTPGNITKMLDKLYQQWEKKLDVVCIDHFNIMTDPIPGMQLQGPALAKYYVRFMTNLAISFGHKGFILLGLSQINREGQAKLEKGKELNGSEFADTSELHRSATTATSLYADDQDRACGMLKLKIIKNRLGPQGQLFMVPIEPEHFKVGLQKPTLELMTVEEFEKLGSLQTMNSSDEIIASLTQ